MRSGSVCLLRSINGHSCLERWAYFQAEREECRCCANDKSMEECTSRQATLRYSGKMLVDSKIHKKEDFSSVLYPTAYL